jgi:tetratricopeptide (TPR) repeat protein
MTRFKRVALCLAATQLSVAAAHSQAPQAVNTRLQVTTTSADAKTAFWAAWSDQTNVFMSRARMQAVKAVSLDPSFGLARTYSASIATPASGLTPAQREQELNRGVADAAKGTTGELIMAAAIRASTLGRDAEAQALAAAAVALMPDEPYVAAYQVSIAPGNRMPLLLGLTRKFPTFAPTFNTLAYAQFTAGDSVVALTTIGEYVRLAPTHPNAHDSYAEILQRHGKYTEAITHYERAVQLDSTFAQGYAGIAESNMLQKKYADAIPHMQRAVKVDPAYAAGYLLIGQAYLQMGRPAEARATFVGAAQHLGLPAAKFAQLTAAALMLVASGTPKAALAELGALAVGAEEQSLPAQAAIAYRNVAVIEAAFGDRKAVAGHLAKATAIAPPPAPNATPATGAAQYRMAALAYALSGQQDLAKASAAQFTTAVAAGNPAQLRNDHEVKAIIAVGDKNFDLAKEELVKAGPDAVLGKALLASALKGARRNAEATALKTEIMSRTATPTVFDVIARAKLQKV